jgi:hypothetical protein
MGAGRAFGFFIDVPVLVVALPPAPAEPPLWQPSIAGLDVAAIAVAERMNVSGLDLMNLPFAPQGGSNVKE